MSDVWLTLGDWLYAAVVIVLFAVAFNAAVWLVRVTVLGVRTDWRTLHRRDTKRLDA